MSPSDTASRATTGIESRLENPPEAKVVVDAASIPQNQPGHFWKFLALGPDGKLYYNVGAPGNIVMPAYFQAAISRVDPRTGIIENYALGVRNSVASIGTRRPSSCVHESWTGLAGRRVAERHVCTWPRARASTSAILLPPGRHARSRVRARTADCKEFTPPTLKLGPISRAIGMRFYTGKMFPAEYQNNIFIAMRGS